MQFSLAISHIKMQRICNMSETVIVSLFWFHHAFLNISYVLHQTNAHIYLKNIKIFYKMLDKKPQHMFRLIDKPSSGGVTTACL
jgi:hypothetical protein